MAVGTGVDFAALLYRPIFDRLAVTATLIPVNGQLYTIAALDKTEGVALAQPGGLTLETLTPIAELMMSDLLKLGLTEAVVDGGTITLFAPGADTSILANGVTWNIISHRMNPSPSGRADGTIYLQLEGDPDG